MVRGKQIAICWHVDDLKVSHVMPKVMDRMIKHPRNEHESAFKDGSGAMEVSRGETHKHLGMTFDYNDVQGQVSVAMFDHLDGTLTVFEKTEPNGGGAKTSAAPTNLFTISEDCEKLPDSEAVEFHKCRGQDNVCHDQAGQAGHLHPIAFLTTRVREPDTDNWKKMVHRIRGTCDMPLILSANGSHMLKWWVDASFAVHPNLQGHAGGGLSLGRGFPIISSMKQKLNARSSAESELVGADDFMPAMCWTRCFMEAQGYPIKDNVSCQDNKSSILLEKNGKASSSKRTKHVNICCFFITDRINKNELSIEWCPTGNMIGDYATRPLQGPAFKKFRDHVMGVASMPAEEPEPKKSKSIGDKTRRPK
jgi:hypothetical protein